MGSLTYKLQFESYKVKVAVQTKKLDLLGDTKTTMVRETTYKNITFVLTLIINALCKMLRCKYVWSKNIGYKIVRFILFPLDQICIGSNPTMHHSGKTRPHWQETTIWFFWMWLTVVENKPTLNVLCISFNFSSHLSLFNIFGWCDPLFQNVICRIHLFEHLHQELCRYLNIWLFALHQWPLALPPLPRRRRLVLCGDICATLEYFCKNFLKSTTLTNRWVSSPNPNLPT